MDLIRDVDGQDGPNCLPRLADELDIIKRTETVVIVGPADENVILVFKNSRRDIYNFGWGL